MESSINNQIWGGSRTYSLLKTTICLAKSPLIPEGSFIPDIRNALLPDSLEQLLEFGFDQSPISEFLNSYSSSGSKKFGFPRP